MIGWLFLGSLLALVLSYLVILLTMDTGPDWLSGLAMLLVRLLLFVLAVLVVLLVFDSIGLYLDWEHR